MEVKIKNYGSTMDTGDHPEVDDTDMLFGTGITMYQMLIDCDKWEITLGRYDVQYANNNLARFGAAPREGHMKRAIRKFGYFRYNYRGMNMFDIEDPDTRKVDFNNNDCIDLYPDTDEAITLNLPVTIKKRKLRVSVMMDTSHTLEFITRISVTGFLLWLDGLLLSGI